MLPVLDPPTAELILGIVGALAAMLDLAEMIREGHGWGTACTFAELGYTFRTIARENPECFPVNSTQELFCTESVLTFMDVYNATTSTKWDDLEDAVLHEGNVCTFECSLEHPNGKTATRSYPIVCANEGLAHSRWTLSAEKGRQRY